MDDLEFIQHCVKGDKQSWSEFVEKYSRLIYNYIYSVLRIKGISQPSQENVQDIFQEFFLSLVKDNFKKLRSFKARNGCSLASWLRQVVVNLTIDHLRKTKPLVSIDEETDEDFSLKEILVDGSASVKDRLSSEEKIEHLKECIQSLDNEDKYFLELHLHRGLGPEELKDIFKISRSAVDMRKFKIVQRLRECFKNKGIFQLDF